MSEIQKSTGTVKWFSGQKGFGFIAPDNEGVDDLFVHQTEIQSDGFRTLREGQRVEFVVSSGDDGRNKAVQVVIHAGGNSSRGGRGRNKGRGRGRINYEGYGGGYGRGGNRDDATDAANVVECYNCGRIGHMARDCFRRSGGPGGRSFGGGGRGGRGGRGGAGGGGGRDRDRDGGRGGGACYTCGEEGHFARDCPNNNQHS